MKNLITTSLILLNIIIMSAQEFKLRDEKYPIQLSEKYSVYQQYTKIEEKDMINWKLYLKKEGEKELKLLDELEVQKNTIPPNALPALKAIANELNQEIIMKLPRLIDAYKEGQRIYVFLYKNRSAMLQIYDFENGVDFKKYEYTLIPLWGGSVMNFGIYNLLTLKKMLGKTYFVIVHLGRSGRGKDKFLMIRDREVYELIFKDTEKTKTFTSPLVSREKEYLQKEIREKLIEHKFLKENNQFVYLGYLDDFFEQDFAGAGNTYFFYKDDIDPFQIRVIKYDNSYKIWTIGGYTENKLLNDVDKNKWGIK